MTERQHEIIKNNLQAFTNNFGEPRIEKAIHSKGFYVFHPADNDNYIQYCENIDYLNGWLYGCVQGAYKVVQFIDKEN